MKTSEFDFELPEGAIARLPVERRDQSRLLVLDRRTGAIEHRRFFDLVELLEPDDLLVVNDTRVLPARLLGTKRASGGRVELLLVEEAGAPTRWRAMAQSSKPLRPGAEIDLAGGGVAKIARAEGDGFFILELAEDGAELAARLGTIPLPPYLGRDPVPLDSERYQTVYADPTQQRSVAAPTAGLHFTTELLALLEARGVRRTAITLDVGPGTFLPVRSDRIEEHRIHAERYTVTERAAAAIEAARAARRVVAVGTTVVRTLESMPERITAGSGTTELFIRPGFELQVVDKLLTNFHLPRSTLLMLVAAFAGKEPVLAAYREAIARGYRFFSYGDAMLIR